MSAVVNRRTFVAAAASAVVARPLTARAQQTAPKVIGWLSPAVQADAVQQAHAKTFEQSLRELGWFAPRNLKIDDRWAGGIANALRAAT